MGMARISCSFITDDPKYLVSWMADARERYAELERALEPLQKAGEYLGRDWQPQPPAYWHRTMERLIPLRQAIAGCCSLFEREQSSKEHPTPLAVVGYHHQYGISLDTFERAFEEVGVLLTSHSAAPYSLEVGHIRQRQQVLEALRKLCKIGQKVVEEGRAGIDALLVDREANQICARQSTYQGRRLKALRTRRKAHQAHEQNNY